MSEITSDVEARSEGNQAKPEEVAPAETKPKKSKKKTLLIVAGFILVVVLNVLAAKFMKTGGLEIEVFPRTVKGLEAYGITETNISMIIGTLVLAVVIIALRIFCIPKFKEIPGKVQSVLELMVGWINDYSVKTGGTDQSFVRGYALTVGAVIVVSGFLELFGLRAPTTDFMLTLALAVVAFILVNVAGFQKKGFVGRFKLFFKEGPLVGPIMIVTHFLIIISLSFRLLGNILGGMIVMELVYAVASVAVPGICNTFFVLFHAGMQTFVFITLFFTYVGEAIED